MTYREILNAVLIRLREPTISTDWSGNINDSSVVSDYQKVIGTLVNDSKKYVESKHDWNPLRETFNVTLVDGTQQYLLGDSSSGVGLTFKILDIINKDTGTKLHQVNNEWLNDKMFPTSSVAYGEPNSYAINGSSQATASREPDALIDFYPVPNASVAGNVIAVNVVKDQEPLKLATDIIKVPYQPVILGAWARAIAERGEDGGTQTTVVTAEALESLTQAIQLDAGNFRYEKDFYVSERYTTNWNNG